MPITFQFPTGWNSTVSYTFSCQGRLSFNSQRDGILPKAFSGNTFLIIPFQFPTGWNSTRNWSILWNRKRIVSIPNGMEFYAPKRIEAAAHFCFNSQRDGILRYVSMVKFADDEGFNSQRDGILPNLQGILSYLLHGFNSQRDGILRGWRILDKFLKQ